MPTTDTITNTDATTPSRTSAETRPTSTTDAATRGESRGAARMNSTAPSAPFQWQADGEG